MQFFYFIKNCSGHSSVSGRSKMISIFAATVTNSFVHVNYMQQSHRDQTLIIPLNRSTPSEITVNQIADEGTSPSRSGIIPVSVGASPARGHRVRIVFDGWHRGDTIPGTVAYRLPRPPLRSVAMETATMLWGTTGCRHTTAHHCKTAAAARNTIKRLQFGVQVWRLCGQWFTYTGCVPDAARPIV